ncbi:MAG: putative transporter, ATP-binding protein [Nocardia sp.]|nr:putative transporter, ATP-binding protein [Nocardia sp.]
MATHDRDLGVQTRELARSFGDRTILDHITLTIPPGQFVALLGRSGSGKSTLLRAPAGLDHDVRGSGVFRVPSKTSVVFQDSRLLPWQRVLANVLYGQSRTRRQAGRELLSEVGLAGRERAWPAELSGGEQQRVALARALVAESTRRSPSHSACWCWTPAASLSTCPSNYRPSGIRALRNSSASAGLC